MKDSWCQRMRDRYACDETKNKLTKIAGTDRGINYIIIDEKD